MQAKYKEKVPDMSYSNQNVEKNAIPNSSLQSLKIYWSHRCRKTRQSKMNYMYVVNTAILKLRIFSGRYYFRLWVFASTGEYFYYWHWRLLPKVLQSINDAKTFKNLVV